MAAECLLQLPTIAEYTFEMKYCILYALTNIHCDEKISVALVCLTESGWSYRYSPEKLRVSRSLLTGPEGDYVTSFVSDFQKNCMDGLSTGAILSNLETLHRYSNNYVILSPVRSLDVPDTLLTPDCLYEKLIDSPAGHSQHK